MTTLRAFHNDPAIKTKYLARLTAHVEADEAANAANAAARDAHYEVMAEKLITLLQETA